MRKRILYLAIPSIITNLTVPLMGLFDVAIVGCGSYGMPLAARIKGLGKQVIHLAGATQILFGIRGARWDARPYMQKFFNENWTRPSATERPKNADLVEGACYW